MHWGCQVEGLASARRLPDLRPFSITHASRHLGCLLPSLQSHRLLRRNPQFPCCFHKQEKFSAASPRLKHPGTKLATSLFTTAKAVKHRIKQKRKPCNKVAEKPHPGFVCVCVCVLKLLSALALRLLRAPCFYSYNT